MKTKDLQRFCAGSDDVRAYIRKPFVVDQMIVATDGQIAVWMLNDGQVADLSEPEDSTIKAVYQLIEGAAKATQFSALNRSVLPNPSNCSKCSGAGTIYQIACYDCGGDGEFTHGENDYTCKTCDGTGQLDVDREEGSGTTCDACNGTGHDQNQRIEVGHCHFTRRNIEKIISLPGVELSINPELPNATAYFRFTGGAGAIMPCRA